MEHYHDNRLLLQRDVLALHSGEAKARYNTVQDLSKIVLSKAWLMLGMGPLGVNFGVKNPSFGVEGRSLYKEM